MRFSTCETLRFVVLDLLTFARRIDFLRFSGLHVYFAALRDFYWWILRHDSNDFSETLEFLFAFVEMCDSVLMNERERLNLALYFCESSSIFEYCISFWKNVELMQIFRGIMPFLSIVILSMVLMYLFPGIALWLPDTLFAN